MYEYSFVGPDLDREATIYLGSNTVVTGAPSGKQALVNYAARDGDEANIDNI
jgi:hypothetical protein